MAKNNSNTNNNSVNVSEGNKTEEILNQNVGAGDTEAGDNVGQGKPSDNTKKEDGGKGNTSSKGGAKDTEKVSVGREMLESIWAELKGLKENIEKKDAEIEMLKSISDKGRLARYEQTQGKGQLIRTAKVAFWEGVPILAWQKVKDEVGFRDGRLVTNQIIRIFLDEMVLIEGKSELKTVDLDYLYWAQNVQCESGEVVERSETDGGAYWTIEMKDSRKVKLDIRFINAF